MDEWMNGWISVGTTTKRCSFTNISPLPDEIELLGTVVQKMHCKAAFMDEYLQIKRYNLDSNLANIKDYKDFYTPSCRWLIFLWMF